MITFFIVKFLFSIMLNTAFEELLFTGIEYTSGDLSLILYLAEETKGTDSCVFVIMFSLQRSLTIFVAVTPLTPNSSIRFCRVSGISFR